MSRRQIARLCCRVLAVYVIIQALSQLPQVMVVTYPLFDVMFRGWRSVMELFVRALPPLILMIAGLFLWRRSELVAAWMVGDDLQDELGEPESRRSITRVDIHCIAFSTVGLWVLSQSIPLGIGIAMQMLLVGMRKSAPEVMWSTGWWLAAIVDVLLRTVIGLSALRRIWPGAGACEGQQPRRQVPGYNRGLTLCPTL